MAEPNFTSNRIGSKPRRRLATADLERICGIEPHPVKRCQNCGIPLSFPRSYIRDSFCYVCCAMLNSLMATGNYWFNVQRQHESEILADIIHKKLLMDGGDADEVSQ